MLVWAHFRYDVRVPTKKKYLVPALLTASLLGGITATPATAATPNIKAPTAFSSENSAALVDSWYQDFLGRGAYGDPGAMYWVDRLKNQAPADVLWSITHSREYNTQIIRYYYKNYLVRDLDRGANYWIDGVTAQRFPLEWVEQNILSSPEFLRGYGGNSNGLIYAWYYGVLGNEGIPNEDPEITSGAINYWKNRVRAVGALGALREMYYTSEGVSGRINGNYYFTLDRFPSDGEIAYWYPKEVESDINVAVLLASTPEYARSL